MARGKRGNNVFDRKGKQKQQRPLEPSDDQAAPMEAVEDKMNIFFRLMKTIPLEVKKSDTIQKIRTQFSEIQGISMVNLKRLFFAGNWLGTKEQKVGDYDITDGSIINLYIDSGSRIQIHVKMSHVIKNITLDVDMSDTILSVKERIQNKEGVTVSNQDLVYMGEELNDGRTIASYNITADSAVYALVRQGDNMQINIRNEEDGNVIALKVKGWYTARNVKFIIESMLGIPNEKQKLCVGQVKLENDRTLADLNILSGQTLSLLSGMVLYVKTQTGKVHTFGVEKSDTIRDIKERIEEKEGIPSYDLFILFDGIRLRDHCTLDDYEIGDGDQFDVMIVQRGC